MPATASATNGCANCPPVSNPTQSLSVSTTAIGSQPMGTNTFAPSSGMNGSPAAMNMPSQTPSTGVIPRRPGKMDPFWIETTAEADRAIWDAAGAMVNPMAASTMTTNGPAMPLRDDGAEGLSHVTFAPEGADFDPCVSRDGSFMVFASTQHRPTSDIYFKQTNGRTITQLTSDPANDIMPAISPDGTRIAFASNRTGSWDIFVMSTQGGQAAQVTADPSQELHPTWSPDGKRLCYCKLGQISGRWELWVTDVNNGASAEFIGYGMFPQWCPKAGTGIDGRDKIMFQRSRERGGRAFSLWTVDYRVGDASSPTEIVASQTAAMINACWSPDGQRIVFATIDNPNQQSIAQSAGSTANYPSVASDLWMANIDGSGRVNLTSGQFMNLMPWWGADGRIYFVSDRAGVPNVWSMTTEKAIQAATGRFPDRSIETANTQHAAPQHTANPAHETRAQPGEVVHAPEGHEPSEGENH